MPIKHSNKIRSQFIPRNVQKYKGSLPCYCRSSWERMMCQYLDNNESVISWSSENIAISYFDPVKNKTRRYYPDFFFKVIDKDNKIKSYLVEVKPDKETKPPTKGKKSGKTILHQDRTYQTNMAKFKAAEIFCRKMGYTWSIISEKQLFRRNK